MAENIYDFLCLYELTKVGKHCGSNDNAADHHHVQEVINIIESQLKTRLILYSPDLNHAGEVFRRPRIS